MEESPFYNELTEELYHQAVYESEPQRQKDIIIITHDQLDYISQCIKSIYETTHNFQLYLWDNASQQETKSYLEQVSKEYDNVKLVRSEENLGFIIPNNELAALGKSPYIILLNSDTEVGDGWDTAMVGWLEAKQEYAQVGYLGGLLEANCHGGKCWCGSWIDYVCGWCMCMPRSIYDKHGLFDQVNLSFAYGEDADLSLRLKQAGYKIHALHLGMVTHYGNATIAEVEKERDVSKTFLENHQYMHKKWADYLANDRILLKKPVEIQ